ncbi:aminoacyltransferase [Vicingaceae bacterium]|nr:aminoacyltransferase [Vicingaceae bacterium]MDC1451221.1 aminoacyltransferase [Vicingaceae bacterium]
MKAKKLFKEFTDQHAEKLPFSLQFNWWNEVVANNWDVAILNNGEETYGIMPYFIRNKGPWSFISNAHFTPYCGPFLVYPEGQKTTTRIAFEHRAYRELIEQLPTFSEYSQNFHLDFNNALAFQWNGFTETNRYTYILSLEQEEKALWTGLRENNRKQIKKAEKTIKISETNDASLLQNILNQSIENKIILDYFQRMITFVDKHKCGKVWKATEGADVHAVLLSISDSKNAYYLLGGNAQEFKNSGAMSLLTWQALLHFKQLGIKQFNFEGSSVAAVEKYFRGFGGDLVSFKRLEKHNSKSLEVAKKLKGSK